MDYTSFKPVDVESKYWHALHAVDKWIEENNYRSYDPYDLLGTPVIVYLRSHKLDPVSVVASKEKQSSRLKSAIAKSFSPIYQSTTFMRILRVLLGARKEIHPKAMGLLAQGYAALYKLTNNEVYLNKIKFCLDWLMTHTNTEFGKYCWGIPYVWQTVRPYYRIPKDAPQSTLSAVNGLAFVDAFEITQDEKYLDVAESCCDFFLENLNVHKISDTQIAFSYTPFDHTHVLNVDLHCGALLSRVWKITKKDNYLDSCMKATDFTVSHQRDDGAWYYSSHLDGFVNAVDHTHTGDNLEYLYIISENVPDFPYGPALKQGLEYYLNNFFLGDGMPKFTDELIYPVDIHSCSQAVITLSTLAEFDTRCGFLAEKVADWILQNIRDQRRGYFYYRLYETGRYDKHDFIGWGDAWMVKALALLIKVLEKGAYLNANTSAYL